MGSGLGLCTVILQPRAYPYHKLREPWMPRGVLTMVVALVFQGAFDCLTVSHMISYVTLTRVDIPALSV